MNDPDLALGKIQEMLGESLQLSPEFRPGYYAAIRTLLRDLEEHLADEDNDISERNYLKEKLVSLRWHVGAMFGFDIDNGHDAQQHRVWALGEIQKLKNLKNE